MFLYVFHSFYMYSLWKTYIYICFPLYSLWKTYIYMFSIDYTMESSNIRNSFLLRFSYIVKYCNCNKYSRIHVKVKNKYE